MPSSKNSTGSPDILCYTGTMLMPKSIWFGGNPLEYTLPLLLIQIFIINVVPWCLKPLFCHFNQPRFVHNVIAGVLIGPMGLGMIPNYMELLFPARSIPILETMGNLGLVSYMCLMGNQIEPATLLNAGRKPYVMAAACAAWPVLVELLAYLTCSKSVLNMNSVESFLVFFGGSLSISCYPVISRILAEVKFVDHDTGKLAILTAIFKNSQAWMLLCVSTTMLTDKNIVVATTEIMISVVMFSACLYYCIRPIMLWLSSQVTESNPVKEYQIMILIIFALSAYFTADVIGVHGVYGAFAIGVAIPKWPHAVYLNDQWEEFLLAFFMPMYFASVGLKVDVWSIDGSGLYQFLVGVTGVSTLTKIVVLTIVGMAYAMPVRESLGFAVIMNTRGLVDIIVLHIALDRKILVTQTYSVLVLISITMTAASTPLAMLIHRPPRSIPYKRRTIGKGKSDSELRIVTCIHATRNIPSLVSLLDFAHPTDVTPIHVYAVHFVELNARQSTMFIYHDNNTNQSTQRPLDQAFGKHLNYSHIKAQSNQITRALHNYEKQALGVSVEPLTVVSPYNTMHEDICSLALDKHVAFIIIPFHRQHAVDGSMEAVNPGIETLNRNILANAPCSVGILVDKGLDNSDPNRADKVLLLFLGGPDDREALAYVSLGLTRPNTNITVLRLIDRNDERTDVENPHDGYTNEKLIDEECVEEFKRITGSEACVASVVYMEKEVGNEEEVVGTIRSMENVYDLYVVGRGERCESGLTVGLREWTDCAELGVIGDFLVSPDSTHTGSVLVIQRYQGEDSRDEEVSSSVFQLKCT